jgi:excisionase family DNA binding protein
LLSSILLLRTKGIFDKIRSSMDKSKALKDILLTRRELMDYLRIKPSTLRKLMLRNEFPYFKLERRVLFRKDDIDKWLESKRVK